MPASSSSAANSVAIAVAWQSPVSFCKRSRSASLLLTMIIRVLDAVLERASIVSSSWSLIIAAMLLMLAPKRAKVNLARLWALGLGLLFLEANQ